MEFRLEFSVGEEAVDRITKNLITILGFDFKHGRLESEPSSNYIQAVDYFVKDESGQEYWRLERDLDKFTDRDLFLEYMSFAEKMYNDRNPSSSRAA